MNITSTHKDITITSSTVAPVNTIWLHTVSNSDLAVLYSNYTTQTSTYSLLNDGWFIIKEYTLSTVQNAGYWYDTVNQLLKKDTATVTLTTYLTDPTTVIANTLNVFVLCYLEDYLAQYNKELLTQMMCNTCSITDSTLRQKRDVAYMSYSALKYLGELDHFTEAQRLLNSLTGCDGSLRVVQTSCGCST